MLRLCVAVAPAESFTCTVKFEFPGAVGVPPIVAPLNESPAGSDPPLTDHVYPPVPPLAASPAEYADPTVPLASDPVVIVSAAALIVMLNPFVADAPELSFTCTVKFEFPTAVGVPPIVAPLNESPAGSDPPLTDHV